MMSTLKHGLETHGLVALPRRRPAYNNGSGKGARDGNWLKCRIGLRAEHCAAAVACFLSLLTVWSLLTLHPPARTEHEWYVPDLRNDESGVDAAYAVHNGAQRNISVEKHATGGTIVDNLRNSGRLHLRAAISGVKVNTTKLALNNALVQKWRSGQSPISFPTVTPVDPSTYLRDGGSEYVAMDNTRHQLRAHIASPEYQQRLEAVRQLNKRGIIINAGGGLFLTNLIVLLKVLRDVHHSVMEVEMFWQGDREMDEPTLHSLKQNFGPLDGHDITKLQHPVKGLHKSDVNLSRFTAKVYSLLHSKFSEVILLDADSVPVQPPEVFFHHPQYMQTGCLFWPDAWTGAVSDWALKDAGLDPRQAKAVLSQGRGWSRRDTESGQVLLDLRGHLDVVEYVFWLNTFGEQLKQYMWGDKDSFSIAFAAAGKAHLFSQVAVPPAGLFKWRENMLLVKETGEHRWGWQLLGFLQHDSWGQPAFVHRTINKFRTTEEPWRLELISAPMSRRWIDYYLAHNSLGPTKGVPWDYVVPDSAFTTLAVRPPLRRVFADRAGWVQVQPEGCPHSSFLDYWTMREAGLSIDVDLRLQALCHPFLKSLLGQSLYQNYSASGYLLNPGLRYMAAKYLEDVVFSNALGSLEEPDGTPIPAWRPNFPDDQLLEGPFASAVHASYTAYAWLLANAQQFPRVTAKES